MKRSDLELWLIVKENFDELFISGLCIVIIQLYELNKITLIERDYLYNEIQEYTRKRYGGFRLYAWDDRTHAKPRKMFIQKRILKAEKNEN